MAYETEDRETQYCFPAINSSCFKKLHTPTNLLILSLAVVDMLVGLVVMPIEATRLIETCWYFGDTFCRVFLTVMGLLFSASLSNMVLIAVDRFVAVCHPLLYPQKITTTKTLTIVSLCWFCSSAYNIAVVMSVSHKKYACHGECTIMITFDWTIADLFLSFLIPCTLIITLYLRIFHVAHQQVKVINSVVKCGKHITEGSVKKKTERKAALTLGIIVTVYLFCWIPFFILTITANTAMASTTAYVLLWILYINSGLNPLIYAFFYPWFKTSVKHILTFNIFHQA
ncbi:trace amine-associated receptor 13c-like [Labeo rohita]|uniref:trace amine-associated receptor 13c-like n=1 Tax=Labeo rohita TaxID=84645 RepID=UPI0021E30FF7|nr:trace amine-associated receptor 13c-like [Labeo rohita]